MQQRKPFRICVTGSHGVGKTSLCLELKEHLAELGKVGFVPETARLLVEQGFAVNDDITSDGVEAYVSIYDENLKFADGDFVLSDRSLLDLYVYTEKLFHPTGSLGAKLGGHIWELVKQDASQIELFVHLPIEFPMLHDGVRPSDENFQSEIDIRIVEALKRLSANYITVSGSPAMRIKTIIDTVKQMSVVYASRFEHVVIEE